MTERRGGREEERSSTRDGGGRSGCDRGVRGNEEARAREWRREILHDAASFLGVDRSIKGDVERDVGVVGDLDELAAELSESGSENSA